MVQSMKKLDDSSEKTSTIIRVTGEIAFQIDILTLNAAVVAAMAGGGGMGFAVADDEVLKLAHPNAPAAQRYVTSKRSYCEPDWRVAATN
jgi:methyl-accepting chemotaxis protein